MNCKKLVSLNPKKYKTITYQQAIKGYSKYLEACEVVGYDLSQVKTFNKWLNTEI